VAVARDDTPRAPGTLEVTSPIAEREMHHSARSGPAATERSSWHASYPG